MYSNSSEIYYKEKLSPVLEYNHKRKSIPTIKEEPEGHEQPEVYGQDLGNYIDKLNYDIEKLKKTFENEEHDFSHKKNIPSVTSTSEYFEARHLENNKLKLVPILNVSKIPVHNRAISFDPRNIFLSKPNIELIEEEVTTPIQQRQSFLEINEKYEDFPAKMQELEKQNREIKEYLEQNERDRVKLQEHINKLSLDQNNNIELLNAIKLENEKMNSLQQRLEDEKKYIETERKDLQMFLDYKLEEFRKKEAEFDQKLKIKVNPDSNSGAACFRDKCFCQIF